MAKLPLFIIALCYFNFIILLTLGFEAIMLGHEPNLVYAPFSGALRCCFPALEQRQEPYCSTYFGGFICLTVFTFMVFVPQSKQFHELFAMVNIFFKKSGPVGKLRKIDFEDEEAEEFGVGKIEDFTQTSVD